MDAIATEPRSAKTRPSQRWFLPLVCLVLVSVVASRLLFRGPSRFEQYRAWLDAAVGHIQAGDLAATNGVVQLHALKNFPAASPPFDVAYVSGSAAQGWSIFFPYWHGKSCNIEGFLYTTTPQASGTITFPVWWGGLGPPGSASILPKSCDVVVERSLSTNWSIAAWRED